MSLTSFFCTIHATKGALMRALLCLMMSACTLPESSLFSEGSGNLYLGGTTVQNDVQDTAIQDDSGEEENTEGTEGRS